MLRLYKFFLHLYPPGFRLEFASEMQTAFSESLEDARKLGKRSLLSLLLREFVHLPIWALIERLAGWREKRANAMHVDSSPTPINASVSKAEPPLSAPTIFLGLSPIVLMSLVTIPAGTPISFLWGGWINFFIPYGLVLVVAGIAWYRGSPRWSYSYTGFLLVFTWYLTSLPAPSFTIAGFRFPPHGALWGNWIWLPLLITLVIVLFARRSWKPQLQFFQNIRFDWTLYTFLLYSAMPWLSWALFDEIRNKSLVVISLLMVDLSLCIGAWFYLRLPAVGQRARSLFYGMLPAILITVIATSAYWHGRQEFWMLTPGNGYADALRGFIFFVVILVIMFFPALVALMKYKILNLRSA